MATRTATKPKMSGTVYAYLSVLLFAIITPANKYLLNTTGIGSTMLAGFLYLGSGLGMTLLFAFRPKEKKALEKPLDRHDLPWIFLMIILDIGAAILTLWGTSLTAAGTAALLSNFELVVTALIAFLLFHEKISPRLWIAIALITLASILLSFEDGIYSLQFSPGALIMMAASACWGLENNVTRRLSEKDPLAVSCIKGLCSGAGSLIIAFILGDRVPNVWVPFVAAALGFVAYGLSFYFYLLAQRELGAAKTSAIFALNPFLGSFISFFAFLYLPSRIYLTALSLMALGSFLSQTSEQKQIGY